MTIIQKIHFFIWVRTFRLRIWWKDTLPTWVAFKIIPARIALWCFIRVYSAMESSPSDEYRRAYNTFIEKNNIDGM